MIRREFFKTTGFLSVLGSLPLAGSCGRGAAPAEEIAGTQKQSASKNVSFKTYRENSALCPVYRVTPDDGYYIHTFYDICPWSPSQRYLACIRFPFQDREPNHLEEAQICLIDMKDRSITDVYSTTGWGFQLGANVQWGKTDRYLYFNDKVDGEGVCVRLDLTTGKAEPLAGPMYHIAPDESCVISFPLDLINETQAGYGYAVDPARKRTLKPGADTDEGIWRTDLKTNKKELLVSLAQAYDLMPAADRKKFAGGTYYFFHSKFNPQGTKVLQVFRCILPKKSVEFGEGGVKQVNPTLMTYNPDGTDLQLAIPNEVWGKGGHHPNWHPAGDRILMNLRLDYDQLRLCTFRPDGSDFKVLSDTVYGSGHPSFHKDDRYIITDVYPQESYATESGEVPIRLIDLEQQTEHNICFVYTKGSPNASVLRVDPHVVWSRDYTKVCFNAAPEGRRQLFVADLSELLES